LSFGYGLATKSGTIKILISIDYSNVAANFKKSLTNSLRFRFDNSMLSARCVDQITYLHPF